MRTPAATNESWPTTVPAPATSASDLMPQSVIGVGESFRWSRTGHGVRTPACENQAEDGGRCGHRNQKRAHIILPAFIFKSLVSVFRKGQIFKDVGMPQIGVSPEEQLSRFKQRLDEIRWAWVWVP